MQSAGRPSLVPQSAAVHCERHRPEQTTLHRLVQRPAATFFAEAAAAAGADLPQYVNAAFDAFLASGSLAHGFLRLRYGDCGHDKLVAFSCKRRAFFPSCAPAAWRRPKRTRWTTSSGTSCSAAALNIHLHCLVLDGVYRRGSNGEPVFVEVPAPSDEARHAVLHKIIARTMKLLTRRGG